MCASVEKNHKNQKKIIKTQVFSPYHLVYILGFQSNNLLFVHFTSKSLGLKISSILIKEFKRIVQFKRIYTLVANFI
jgi:hypothetical protein